jgi:hypothetical protein
LSLFLAGSLLLAAVPGSAYAQCNCGGMSNIMSWAADKIINGIVVPMQQQMSNAAGYETANLHQDLVAIREAILMTKDQLDSTMQQVDQDQAERATEKTYEPASQPETNCGNNQMGGGLQTSKQTTEQAAADIMEKIYERKTRFKRPFDYRKELGGEDWPGPPKAVTHFGVMTSGKTLTLPETKEAEQIIESMTNPIPPQVISKDKEETLDGATYMVQLRNFEAKQALYQSVLAKRVSERAPTVEGLASWARGKWADMGAQGDPPGLIDGKMSQDALFWILANMRLSSANWHEEILPQLPEAGLLRELASMQAVQLELSRKQNELLENIAMMMAMDGLDRLDGPERQALRAQFNRVIGSDPK